MVERVPTGIAGLDNLIEGGLPKGSITLISGTPGTGKSILCSQILYANALKGKKCLYLNLEQNEGRLDAQMEQFGWNPEKAKKNLKIVGVDSSNPEMVRYVLNAIQEANYDLIALDSLDSISSTPVELGEMGKMGMEKIVDTVAPTIMDAPTIGRMKLKKIFAAIAKSKATALLTSEKVEGAQGISRDTISEFLCDGIIILDLRKIAKKSIRSFEVRKMRQTKHSIDLFLFEITGSGLVVKNEVIFVGEKISGLIPEQ